jgi:RNA binding exosome subunit
MPTTTILHRYEKWLEERQNREEISASTSVTYLNDASRVFEVLLKHVPAAAIEDYLRSEGYKGHYGHIIESLRAMARGHREVAFGDPRQPRLPGV